jgi:hypothetical protein
MATQRVVRHVRSSGIHRHEYPRLKLMPAKKFAISIPEDVMKEVDVAARARGVTRSRLIADILRKTAELRRDADITRELNRLFEDPELVREQGETAQAYRARASSVGTRW